MAIVPFGKSRKTKRKNHYSSSGTIDPSHNRAATDSRTTAQPHAPSVVTATRTHSVASGNYPHCVSRFPGVFCCPGVFCAVQYLHQAETAIYVPASLGEAQHIWQQQQHIGMSCVPRLKRCDSPVACPIVTQNWWLAGRPCERGGGC